MQPVAPPLVRMQPVAPVVPLEEQAQVVPVVPKKPAGRNTVIIPQFSEILSRSATRSAKKASEAKGTTPVKRTKKATLDEFLLAPSNLFPSSGDSPVKLPAESQVELTDKQTLDLEAFLDAQLLADALKAKRFADARVQRLADKKAKKLEEEAQRIAVDEVETEAQRIADARAQTLADARVKRQADLKAKKLVEEAQRIAVETEAQRLADPNAEKISPTKALRLQRQQQVDIIANISQNEKTNKTPKSPKPIPILFDATSTTQPESKPIPTLTTLQVRRNQLEALNKKLKQNATPYQNLNRMPQNKKLSEPIPESIPEPIPEIKAWWQIQHEKEMALIKAETELEEKEREIRNQEREIRNQNWKKENEAFRQKSLEDQRVRNEQIAQKESIQAKRE